MARASRSHLSTEQRRETVRQLREQGHTMKAIAAAVDASTSTIHKDLRSTGDPLVGPHCVEALEAISPPRSSPEPALDRLDTLLELLELARRPDWHADASCRVFPEYSWFPERGESVVGAELVCSACRVRDECAAAGAREHFGIWGGMSARARGVRRSA